MLKLSKLTRTIDKWEEKRYWESITLGLEIRFGNRSNIGVISMCNYTTIYAIDLWGKYKKQADIGKEK